MILTLERLKLIIVEIYDNSTDTIQNTMKNICDEMRRLDSDFGRSGIIGQMSLASKPISDMPHGGSGEIKDLSSISIMVSKHTEYQMGVLRDSLQQCLNKQKVMFQVRNLLIKLSEEDKKLLFYSCKYSQRKARELLAGEGIPVSRVLYEKKVPKLLEFLLNETNERIKDFDDYEDFSFQIANSNPEKDTE